MKIILMLIPVNYPKVDVLVDTRDRYISKIMINKGVWDPN